MCIFNVCRIERGDGGEGGEALHGELAAGSRRAPRRGFEPAARAPRDGSSRRLDPASPLAPPSPRRPTILSLYLFGISLHDVRVPPGSFFRSFSCSGAPFGRGRIPRRRRGRDTRTDEPDGVPRGRRQPLRVRRRRVLRGRVGVRRGTSCS